jgi:hypothetical protein
MAGKVSLADGIHCCPKFLPAKLAIFEEYIKYIHKKV